jgi:hypothetical protein
MDGWFDLIQRNPYNGPFVTYVFGEDNFKMIEDMGFECRLLDKKPLPFDALQAQYRHKLEALRYAFEEDGVDELVHMDWDVFPTKTLPEDFWEVLGQKSDIQSCLQQYKRRKCTWRGKVDVRKISNGGFIYLRDKNAPEEIIKIWEKKRGPSMEPAMSRFIDEKMGGWKGKEYYWEHHEPDFCKLHKDSVYLGDDTKKKNVCLVHYQGGDKNITLNRVKRRYRKMLQKENKNANADNGGIQQKPPES